MLKTTTQEEYNKEINATIEHIGDLLKIDKDDLKNSFYYLASEFNKNPNEFVKKYRPTA